MMPSSKKLILFHHKLYLLIVVSRTVYSQISEMCGSWNFWVRVSPQIWTKNSLLVRVCNKREILHGKVYFAECGMWKF